MWTLIGLARDDARSVSQLVAVFRHALADAGFELPDVTHPDSIGTGPFLSRAAGAGATLDVEWSRKLGHEKDVRGASREIIVRARWGDSTLETTKFEATDPESCGPVSRADIFSPYALRVSVEADEAFAQRLMARLVEDGWRVARNS